MGRKVFDLSLEVFLNLRRPLREVPQYFTTPNSTSTHTYTYIHAILLSVYICTAYTKHIQNTYKAQLTLVGWQIWLFVDPLVESVL